jgi:hypothetical protein
MDIKQMDYKVGTVLRIFARTRCVFSIGMNGFTSYACKRNDLATWFMKHNYRNIKT